jgi:oligopeptide transport system ATP-binding protein
MTVTPPLLSVEDLVVRFRTHEGTIHAVNGVTFEVAEGERLGLVGESGCGKSVTNLALIQLLPKPAGRIEGGRVIFDGQDLTQLREEELRAIRGRDVAMIFQDPMTSLNPVLTIEEQMVETIVAHQEQSKDMARSRAIELLSMVGIPQPETRLKSFPHQFSGGMRQRVMIAMALALAPKLMIADEPTTALDVTIQAQVLELLRDLTNDFGTALILITHDLGVVAGMTNRINVMYAGFIVESATTPDLFAQPSHPYTVGLLHSIPRLDAEEDEPLLPIEGRPPDMRHAPTGCPFAPRCRWRLPECWSENPSLRAVLPGTPLVMTGSRATHQIACHNPPTVEEQVAGRPIRPGFAPAPAPEGVVDEVGAGHLGGRPDGFVGLVHDIQAEEGPISMAPGARALPAPPEPEHRSDGVFDDD